MEVTVRITARELMDRGLWSEACDIKHINPYAVNEGLMESSEQLTFTLQEAKWLGLDISNLGEDS